MSQQHVLDGDYTVFRLIDFGDTFYTFVDGKVVRWTKLQRALEIPTEQIVGDSRVFVNAVDDDGYDARFNVNDLVWPGRRG